MRIQRVAFVVLVALSLSLLQGQTVWSQISDPFGSDGGNDPFAAPPRTVSREKENSPSAGRDHAATVRASQRGTPSEPNIRVTSVNQGESGARILATLQDETIQSFAETTLEDAIQTISKCHAIPIVIDHRALEEIGMSAESPVSINLKHVSLQSFLRLMLRDLDLTYMVKDEVMQITTTEAAEQMLISRMYRLPDNLVPNSDKVLEAMRMAVSPQTWDTLGGPSVVTNIDHVMIVSTNSDIHQRVEAFLNALIESYGN